VFFDKLQNCDILPTNRKFQPFFLSGTKTRVSKELQAHQQARTPFKRVSGCSPQTREQTTTPVGATTTATTPEVTALNRQ